MAALKFKPWTPYGTPPAGTYDPSLDFGLAAGQRGLGDTVTDAATSARRGVEDYGFGVADLNRSQQRGLADIGTQRGYATDDHQRALDMLARSYARLGGQQNQQARVAGVSTGGALVQAARKRQENQAVDQQPIDTGYQRQLTGLDTAQGRLAQDTAQGIARLGVNTQRGIADSGTQVQRAGREQVFLGTDTAAAKAAQATMSGWDPGARPANEFMGGQYGQHRVIQRGGMDYIVDPTGKILGQRRRA